MQSQGAENEVEAASWECSLFKIDNLELNCVIGRNRPGAFEHVQRNVDTENTDRTLLTRPTRKPTESATKVQNSFALQAWNERPELRPFPGAVAPALGAL